MNKQVIQSTIKAVWEMSKTRAGLYYYTCTSSATACYVEDDEVIFEEVPAKTLTLVLDKEKSAMQTDVTEGFANQAMLEAYRTAEVQKLIKEREEALDDLVGDEPALPLDANPVPVDEDGQE